jgi:hypothetical protein
MNLSSFDQRFACVAYHPWIAHPHNSKQSVCSDPSCPWFQHDTSCPNPPPLPPLSICVNSFPPSSPCLSPLPPPNTPASFTSVAAFNPNQKGWPFTVLRPSAVLSRVQNLQLYTKYAILLRPPLYASTPIIITQPLVRRYTS